MKEQLRDLFTREVMSRLSSEDDLAFWLMAFDTVLTDIDAARPGKTKNEVFLQIGACCHWKRPHQTRWTAAGGFAGPVGYVQKCKDHVKNSQGPVGSGLPELEWFVLVHWNRQKSEWEMVPPKFFGKKRLVFRAALPTRTARHSKAAVHTIWTPGAPGRPDEKVVCFYGFRKVNQSWACVAFDDFGPSA
jgi:hypothetical protein